MTTACLLSRRPVRVNKASYEYELSSKIERAAKRKTLRSHKMVRPPTINNANANANSTP